MAPTPQHAMRKRRAGSIRPAVFAVLVGVLAFAGTGMATAYYQLQNNIDSHEIGEIVGTNRPTVQGQTQAPDPTDSLAGRPVNILVMGSDTREGQETSAGSDVEGMRSDTTLLIHIAANREWVEVVSIPRDLIVEIPSCLLPDGNYSRSFALGTNEFNGQRFNAAFYLGGQTGDVKHAAACTIQTVEMMTNIFIDDWAVVDFDGFRDMVDAIGGVPMCIEKDINDRAADLKLEAGCQVLNGKEALGLARARKTLGDGSDLSRIGRQQELMMAMVDKALSAQVMSSPASLLKFLGAATDSLTTSTRLGSMNTLAGIAWSLRSVSGDDIHFTSLEFGYSGNVVLQTPATDAHWERLLADQPPTDPEADDPEPTEEDSTD